MRMESNGGMILTGKNRRTRTETCPSATSSTTNPTWTYPEVNPSLRGDRPGTNRLSHGMALSGCLLPRVTQYETVGGKIHRASVRPADQIATFVHREFVTKEWVPRHAYKQGDYRSQSKGTVRYELWPQTVCWSLVLLCWILTYIKIPYWQFTFKDNLCHHAV
jgi:hypothetical protein